MENKINYQKLFLDNISQIDLSKGKPTLLLHACCGPCFTIPHELLKDYFDMTIMYNNSNIYPESEYLRRVNELRKYLEDLKSDIQIIQPTYNNEEYNKDLEPYASDKEGRNRCRICFRKRLEEGFSYAKEHHFDYFGTVMTISRYKNAQDINKIGQELAEKYAPVKWLFADFKKNNGYEKSLIIIRNQHMYFQEYCGCKYSYQAYLEKQKNPKK